MNKVHPIFEPIIKAMRMDAQSLYLNAPLRTEAEARLANGNPFHVPRGAATSFLAEHEDKFSLQAHAIGLNALDALLEQALKLRTDLQMLAYEMSDNGLQCEVHSLDEWIDGLASTAKDYSNMYESAERKFS